MTLPEDTILENRYRIDGLLSHGGMGAIYRAFDTNLSTPVAIKENFLQSAHYVTQFKKEALILARLRHPALPRVIHHFSFEGQQYLVMDFIEGKNLWEIVQSRGQPLKEKEALDYAIQVCQAVDYLHRQTPPIIHRDIKPQNIKITPEGRAMLVDFGIAKQVIDDKHRTEAGAQGVTAGFSPPEQYSGSGTTPTSDIYSLGATLYAVLTGKKPPDSLSLLRNKVKFVPPDIINPRLSQDVSKAIAYAMQPKPVDRPQFVAEWQHMLEKITRAAPPSEPDEKAALVSASVPNADEETWHGASARQEGTTQFWLVDSTGMGYPIGSQPVTLGRHSSSDVVIEDLNVSRTHASLRVEDGRCLVKDEGSANGTLLNGHRLQSEWSPLNQGDVLVVGPARFYLTGTKPVKLAPPKSKDAALSPAVPVADSGSPSGAAFEAAAATTSSTTNVPPPATEPVPSSALRKVSFILLIIILLAVAGVAGYVWFNPDLMSSFVAAGPSEATPDAEVAVQQTQTAEAIIAETVAAAVQLTAQANEQRQATQQAEAIRQSEAATAEAIAGQTDTPTPTKSPTATATTKPTAITTDTFKLLTATPTPTPAVTPTRKVVPVVSGPTLMPLNSLLSVERLGSGEVTDVDINPKNPKEVFALVKRDGIYKSSNGGDGPWARVDLDGSAITSVVIDAGNPARIYASTWNAVLKSEDGGNTWEPKTNGLVSNQAVDLVVIHPSNPDILYAGVGETLVVSTDQGENWTSQLYGEGLRVGRLYNIVVDPFKDDTIYVSGLASSIYKSDNGGRNFIQLEFNMGKGSYGLAAHPAQEDILLAGFNSSEGGIAKTFNGFDFAPVNTGLIFGGADSAYSAITYVPSNPNIVYAGSGYENNDNAKGIFKSIDGGQTWSSVNNGLAVNPGTGYPHYVKAIAIDPTNPNTVFAAAGSGLYKSVDGGATWRLR